MADKRCFNRQWCRNINSTVICTFLVDVYAHTVVPVGIRSIVVEVDVTSTVIKTVVAIAKAASHPNWGKQLLKSPVIQFQSYYFFEGDPSNSPGIMQEHNPQMVLEARPHRRTSRH